MCFFHSFTYALLCATRRKFKHSSLNFSSCDVRRSESNAYLIGIRLQVVSIIIIIITAAFDPIRITQIQFHFDAFSFTLSLSLSHLCWLDFIPFSLFFFFYWFFCVTLSMYHQRLFPPKNDAMRAVCVWNHNKSDGIEEIFAGFCITLNSQSIFSTHKLTYWVVFLFCNSVYEKYSRKFVILGYIASHSCLVIRVQTNNCAAEKKRSHSLCTQTWKSQTWTQWHLFVHEQSKNKHARNGDEQHEHCGTSKKKRISVWLFRLHKNIDCVMSNDADWIWFICTNCFSHCLDTERGIFFLLFSRTEGN